MTYTMVAVNKGDITRMISAIIPAKQACYKAMAITLISILPVPPIKVPK
jgi:hypothetical protein